MLSGVVIPLLATIALFWEAAEETTVGIITGRCLMGVTCGDCLTFRGVVLTREEAFDWTNLGLKGGA